MAYLEPSIVGELSHWTRKLKSRIPRKIIKDIAPQATIITDAAPSGWGATIVESSTGKILTQSFGKWTPQISSPTTSSNRRELISVQKAVELTLPILKEKNWTSIKVMTDNQTTVTISTARLQLAH
jgi:ribonuclease HI